MNFEIADKSTEVELNRDNAILYCFSLGVGWRLPTNEELNQIYHSENDFLGYHYWSSTNSNGNLGWAQNFGTGNQNIYHKGYGFYIRAIRDLKDNCPI